MTTEQNNIYIKYATIEHIPVIQQLANECYLIAYTGIHSEEQNKNCTGCLRCYHNCPKRAIEWGKFTKNKGQKNYPKL